MVSICSITSLIAAGCLSGGYLYFKRSRLIDDRNLACTSSRTSQSVLVSRCMTWTSSRAIGQLSAITSGTALVVGDPFSPDSQVDGPRGHRYVGGPGQPITRI